MAVVEMTEEELSRLNEQTSALTTENFELREQLNKLLESNASLNAELERQTKTLVASQVAQACGDKDGDKKQKSRFNRLVDKVKDAKDMVEMQTEIDVLQAQIAQHESETARLHAMEMNTRHLQTFTREAQLKLAEKEEVEKDLRKTLAEYKALVAERPELEGRANDIAVQSRLDDALARLEDLQAEEAALRTAVTERDGRCADLRAQITAKEVDAEALRKRCAAHDASKQRVAELETQLGSARMDCEAWKEQCEHMGGDLLQNEENADATKREIAQLRELSEKQAAELEGMALERQLRKTSEASLCDARAQVEDLSTKLEAAKQAAATGSEAQSQATKLSNKVTSLKEAVKNLEASLEKERERVEELRRQLAGAEEGVAERDLLRRRLLECETRALVAGAVEDAAWRVEQGAAAQAAAGLRVAEAALAEARKEAGALKAETDAFDQRLADLRSEQKIETRKKDGLIRELQASLKTSAERESQHESQLQQMQSDPLAGSVGMVASPSMCSVSGNENAPESSSSDMATLQREEIVLIQKVAQLKQTNWKLEEEKRNLSLTVNHLRGDNEKKATIINHWLSGPAAEQLLQKRSKLLQPKKGGNGWMAMAGMSGSSKQADLNETLQKVVQDTLAENIMLSQKVADLEAKQKA